MVNCHDSSRRESETTGIERPARRVAGGSLK